MRYLDSQLDGSTPELFSALAEDLRMAQSVRLTDTSWRARADFDQHLERVLASFTAAGGRIVAALFVVIATLALARAAGAAPQPKAAAKSGASMCVLTAADFAAAGITTGAKPTANVDEGGASVYRVYAGKSSATGGVELDVFYPAGANANDAKATMETASSEVGTRLTPIAIPGADEARWSATAKSGGPAFGIIVVRRSNLVFTLGIPTGKDAQSQLVKLAGLVLQRF